MSSPRLGLPRLGLYIHWPFCLSKCPYCDFNSHLAKEIDTQRWKQALSAELRYLSEQYHADSGTTDKAQLDTIFFGGGTPSLMPAEIMDTLIDLAGEIFTFHPEIEITAEANPTSVETAKIADFAQAGINRISLGIQSLSEEGLRYLGREHSPDEALAALDIAQHRISKVSCDLIYGLPQQSAQDWEEQLTFMLNRGLQHLSAYQLTIEPGTVFYSRARRGEVMTADDDHVADLYGLTETLCADSGLYAYEVSNYAQRGAESRHNIGYWKSHDWLGIGPGAHGQYWAGSQRKHTQNRRSPSGWLDACFKQSHGCEEMSVLPLQEVVEIYWMMGLRLTSGMPLSPPYESLKDYQLNTEWVEDFCAEGWLKLEDGNLRADFDGRIRLNQILEKILS